MEKSLRKIFWVFLVLAIALGFRFVLEYLFNIVWEFFDFSSIFGFVVRSLIVVIFALVWLSITLRSDKPYQRLPWLLLLTFEPVAGMTLFLTFGRSFKRSRRFRKRPLMKKSHYITHENKHFDAQRDLSEENSKYSGIFNTAHHLSYHRPYQNSTKTKILKNGEAFFPSLLEAIKDAKTFIFVQFYIFRSDALGREVTEKLMQKAKEGVDVKVIFDGLGSATSSRKHLKRMRESGIDLVLNDKIYFPLFNTRVNYRNHRKIVVVDGKIGFTGGMNLANEYDNRIKNPYYFRDTMIRLEGTAVKSLTSIFLKDYYYNTNTFLDTQKYYPDHKAQSEGVVQIIQSGPDSEEAHIRDLYLKMIFSAQKSIKITTPYMAMDQETLTALKVAVKSGIEVSIIIPGVPDKQLVYMITQSFVSSLLEHGVKIYKYNRGFCHSKVMIVDDEIASIGTYNLDNRSAFLSFEVSALTTNKSATTSLIKDFENDLDDSTLITCEMWRKRNVFMRFLENLLAILSPII
jgi:cardiolipin synthase